MKHFYIHIARLGLLFSFMLYACSLSAQTNSNPIGFENNSITNWTGGSGSESAAIETGTVRTGDYALALTTTSTSSNMYWYSHNPYGASATGTYVHFIYWAMASTINTSVNASLRYSTSNPPTGIGTLSAGPVTALSTSAWTQVKYYRGNANGRYYYPSPRRTTSNATTFYVDDVIIYTSNSTTTDIVAPTAASSVNGTNVEGLTWTNGTDTGTGATGVQATLVFKRTGGVNGSADLSLNNQAIYSLTSTEGPSVVGNWTLLDATIDDTETTYASGTFTVDEEYAIVHRDLAYNYSSPAYVVVTPSSLALLTTESASSITKTTAVGNATLTYEGTGVITSGICWNATGTPTIGDNLTVDGPTTIQTYTGAISGLTANTTYYVRAYATTAGGTSYGNEVSFPTLSNAPTVGSATDTTSVSFRANWSAPSAQGSATLTYQVQVTETSGDYTTLAADVSGISGLSRIITGLSPTTTYYYRVRAVNTSGAGDWSAESISVITLTQSTLTVNISPTASGTVTADTTITMTDGVAESFTTNEVVTLTATPAYGYGFLRWVVGLDRNGDNPYYISVSENKTVTALFGPVSCTSYNLEDVDPGELTTAAYVTTTFESAGETWQTIDGRLNVSSAYAHDGSTQSIRLLYATGAIITPTVIRPTSLSFWARIYSIGNEATIKVFVSTDNGATFNPTEILSETLRTDGDWQQFTVDSVFTSTAVKFKIVNSFGNDNIYNIVVDDIDICEGPDAIPPTCVFDPINGTNDVALGANLTITSDEKLYRYLPTTGALIELTVNDAAFTNADTLATFLTLLRVSDNASIPFAVNIDASGTILTINPTNDFDYYTQYRISLNNTADASGNVLSSTQYSQFRTIIPPSPVIYLEELSTTTEYDNGDTYNYGTYYTVSSISKTFRITNTGTDPLSITSCILSSGSEYTTTTSPDATVAAGAHTDIVIQFLPTPTAGVFSDTLTIISNDVANATYVVYLSGIYAKFVLPYTYESACESPVMSPTEMTHDYSTLSDIPTNITRKNGSPLTTNNFYSSYTVFQGEGNCMPSGSSVLKVGQDTSALEIALPNCGEVTLKWCSNGYRKVKISDRNNNTYFQSTNYQPSSICYTTSTVVNIPDSIHLRIEFIGNDSALLTTLYYMQITPYNASLQSSACNIVAFSTGFSGERVRIYDDIILVSVPTGTDLSSITPSTITPSPFASVSPAAGVSQDFTTDAISYTVTAQNGETKTYAVRVEHVINYGTALYTDSINITVDMDRDDKTIQLVEVTNSSCEVPVSGNGSEYTIHFLDPTDMPVEGYQIQGPSKICIGTIGEYTLVNAVPTNNPSYAWSISGTAKDLFTIIGDTISDVLRLLAPNEMVEGTIDFSIIVEYDPSQCIFLRGEDNIEVGITDQAPDPITGITAECAYNGLLTVLAEGSTDATSYNWDFTPFTTVVSQDDNSIVLNIGTSINDISAKVNTQNGCGITINENEYDIPYATDWSKWNGSVDTEWNRNANWSNRVPKACTDVVIPDVGGGVAYPIIGESGECHYITFEPGGAVLGLEKLDYVRAYIQLETQREKWYTLTAPVKNMYSADYAYQGTPVTKMRLFDQVNPDSLTTGGMLYTGTWTRSFSNGEVPLTPGIGYAFWADPKTYNFPNAVTYEYTNLWFYFPRESAADNLMTLQYPYSTYSGRLLTAYPINLPRDASIAYRFAMEDNNNVLQDLKVYIKPGLNLLGNPLMTHLDFTTFYASNTNTIKNKVKFWNGTTFTTYMTGPDISSSLDLTSTSIPPMQAFFVEKALVPTSDSVLFDLDGHFIADLTTKLRRSSSKQNTMHIKTNNGLMQSYAAIAMRDEASNGYGDDDAFKLFSQFGEVPEVYTLADGEALDINMFDSIPYRVPLGLKTTKLGEVTFSFIGAESFGDLEVTLLNLNTGEEQNLKVNPEYVLNYDSVDTDGYLFIEFRKAGTYTNVNEEKDCIRCIRVYQKDNKTIGVESPIDDKIDNITVWEQSGKMLYNKFQINHTVHNISVSPHQACVVRVATESSTYVVKLLMK